MKTQLSALLDGELDPQEATQMLDVLRHTGDNREAAVTYHLIGDALRGESRLDRDLTASIMVQLEEEPTVLAPRSPRSRHDRLRPALALAASAAGVAVVAWLVMAPQVQEDRLAQVQTKAATQPANTQVLALRTTPPEMQEYLLAHQAQSSTLRLSGGAHQIRTVSFNDTGAGK